MDAKRFGETVHLLMRDVNLAITRAVHMAFEPLPVTRGQSIVLMEAARMGGAVPVLNLCELMNTPASNVTNICNRLEKSGYIEKVRGKDDRRKVSVRLTEKGQKLVDSIRASHERMALLVTEGSTDQDRDAIVDGLTRLRDLLHRNTQKLDDDDFASEVTSWKIQ